MTLHSPQDMMAAVSASINERTGRSLDDWVQLVLANCPDPLDQNSVRKWLKSEHGIAQNTQWAIADAAARAAGWQRPSEEEYALSQYTGNKAALLPIFEELRALLLGFGPDVVMEGRGTYTPFVRKRQFAAVAAATRERVDVGLRFVAAPTSPLLSPAKAPGQATHKLSLTSVADITPEVEALLRAAYEQNGNKK